MKNSLYASVAAASFVLAGCQQDYVEPSEVTIARIKEETRLEIEQERLEAKVTETQIKAEKEGRIKENRDRYFSSVWQSFITFSAMLGGLFGFGWFFERREERRERAYREQMAETGFTKRYDMMLVALEHAQSDFSPEQHHQILMLMAEKTNEPKALPAPSDEEDA